MVEDDFYHLVAASGFAQRRSHDQDQLAFMLVVTTLGDIAQDGGKVGGRLLGIEDGEDDGFDVHRRTARSMQERGSGPGGVIGQHVMKLSEEVRFGVRSGRGTMDGRSAPGLCVR